LDKIELRQKGFIAMQMKSWKKFAGKTKTQQKSKEKILVSKHQQAEKKVLRGKVVAEE